MRHSIDKPHSAIEWTLDRHKINDSSGANDALSQLVINHSVSTLFHEVLVRTIKYQSPTASVVTSVAMIQFERSVVLFVLSVIIDFTNSVSFGL